MPLACGGMAHVSEFTDSCVQMLSKVTALKGLRIEVRVSEGNVPPTWAGELGGKKVKVSFRKDGQMRMVVPQVNRRK